MYNIKLLKSSLFEIKAFLFWDKKFIETMPWGEVDWQSGKERWKLIFYALFEGYHDIHTKISLIPEVVVYIEEDSITFDGNFINFSALSVFRNNPYFSKEVCEYPFISNEGNFANGYMELIGRFQIIRKAKPNELVTWINV